MLTFLLSLSRPFKRLVSVGIDTLAIIIAFWFAMFLRLGEGVDLYHVPTWSMLSVVILFSIILNINLGLYRAVIRYLSSTAVVAVSVSVLGSAALVGIGSMVFAVEVPRSIPVIFGAFLLLFVGGSRLFIRHWANRISRRQKINVLIYGAGSSGIQLVNALRNGNEYNPVAFVDDDKGLQGLSINGIRVRKPTDIQAVIAAKRVDKILLALPSATNDQRARVLNELEKTKLEVLAVPGLADIVAGKAKIDEFVEVSIDDLLGRDPVPANPELMHADIEGKVVMITGAGGSIGSELCRQILMQQPKTVVLLEASEYNLYAIHQELEKVIQSAPSAKTQAIELHAILGKVQNKARMMSVIKSFHVQTIYHAAAYKHVPIVENNVVEGVYNNIFGTLHCALAALECEVETFVLISTDKAVRPTNTMGTTKRMAELILQALADEYPHRADDAVPNTRFCMVRFGNVLGSSGSVVPLFKSQIKQGGPITLTHKDITRYFMTIPEAAQLVIQAGSMGMGGDVFVLDMGQSVKIYDLAYKMIHLSGLHLKHAGNPDGDIEIVETGLRPGEKLYEELLIGDNVQETGNARIMTAHEEFLPWYELQAVLQELKVACEDQDQTQIRQLLLNAPTGFKPVDEICDLVYLAKAKHIKSQRI